MECEIVCLNEEIDSLHSLENFKKYIYHYEYAWYNGSGCAIGIQKDDDMICVYDLGHCSCYGPCDDGPNEIISKEEFINKYENSEGNSLWAERCICEWLKNN